MIQHSHQIQPPVHHLPSQKGSYVQKLSQNDQLTVHVTKKPAAAADYRVRSAHESLVRERAKHSIRSRALNRK